MAAAGGALAFWSHKSLIRSPLPEVKSCFLNACWRLSKALQQEKMNHGFWSFLRTPVESWAVSYAGPEPLQEAPQALICGYPTHPVTLSHIYPSYPLLHPNAGQSPITLLPGRGLLCQAVSPKKAGP